MSFVTEEEGNRRLVDPRNVLTRVNRDESTELPFLAPTPILPALDGDLIDSPSESSNENQAQNQSRPSSSKLKDQVDPTALLKLDRLLNPDRGPGRKPNIRNRTIEENAAIAVTGKMLGGTQTEKLFGVSNSQQNHLQHGYVSSVPRTEGKDPKEDLLQEIYSQALPVQRKAFTALNLALDELTPDKIKKVSDIEKLVRMAKGLSGIVKDVTPKEGDIGERAVHFHIYRPEQHLESEYEVVEVNADGSSAVANA